MADAVAEPVRRLPREIAVAALLLGALVVAIFVGRWEGSHNASVQNARMAAVFRLATARGLISSELDRYRLADGFDCLAYHPVGEPRAISTYELCFDSTGHLVQTIDRRTDPPHFGSLLEAPGQATLSVPVHRLLAAFAAVGAFRDPRFAGVTRTQSTLPVAFNDIGLFYIPKPKHHP